MLVFCIINIVIQVNFIFHNSYVFQEIAPKFRKIRSPNLLIDLNLQIKHIPSDLKYKKLIYST